MPGKHIPASQRAEIRRTLDRVVPTFGGRLTDAFAEQFAAAQGISIATLWRIYREPTPDDSNGRELSTLKRYEKVVIAGNHGVLKRAWRQLKREGKTDIGYEAFVKQFRKLPHVEQVGLTKGGRMAAEAGLYSRQDIKHRNERWHFDHTEADEEVVYRNRIARPWVSLLLDGHTRMLLAAVATFGDGTRGDPFAEQVTALLVQAMIGWEGSDGNRYGGIPATVAYDNALAHTAQAVTNGLGMLGVYGYAIPKASPWRQGKAERAVRTFTEEVLADQPGYLHGLETRYAKAPLDRTRLRGFREFTAGLDAYIDYYNFERPHQGIGGLTPAEKWNLDRQPLEFADRDEVRRFFTSDGQIRIVSGLGVHVRNVHYTDPALTPGRKVVVRYLPSNMSFVDVYTLDGEFVCTAVPHGDLTPEARARMSKYRENGADRTSSYIKEAYRRRVERAEEEAVRRSIVDPDDNDPEEDEYLEFLDGHLREDGGRQ